MTEHIGTAELAAIIRKHNHDIHDVSQHLSKKKALRFYLKEKAANSETWQTWNIDDRLDAHIVKTLQMKPRRTASGVATITVITKPAQCTSSCLYCPNDIRMPKSYLTDEPACQRAERNFFDPYLQVASRLKALTEMGHPTDKIELIALGGTWSDYPREYQIWYVNELFRALNDSDELRRKTAEKRRVQYRKIGIANEPEELSQETARLQSLVNQGKFTYNQAIAQLYAENPAWQAAGQTQCATLAQLEQQHVVNETAAHRVVGLVIETRPDTVTPENLTLIRQLGCTKVQMGIQSLNPEILKLNKRAINLQRIRDAFALLRVFGFKIHAHFMVNLYGSTQESDLADYREFVTNPAYLPDEVKLYPCVLVEGTGLCQHHADGTWQPYDEEALVGILAEDTLATPPYMRISRMIRDISAHDIIAGSKKTNLRQMVEAAVSESGQAVREIRMREISTGEATVNDLQLEIASYCTAATEERFLQWVTPDNKIVGFLRLSLPHAEYVNRQIDACDNFPIKPHEAMIREVHVYGRAAKLHATGFGAQHLGLGKQLVERACELAKENGFQKINVISAIGTREYYRSLGFADNGLYQQRTL